MLEEIRIRDLGVIAGTVLPLGPGFTAITGETGAGKTMLVQALGLLMGERAAAGSVREGCERASVSGVLSPVPPAVAERADELGGVVEDNTLVLSRTVGAEGRSRANIGGAAVPVGVLGEIASQLFAVHGQSEQLRVKSAAVQRDILDRFAGDEFAAVFADYTAAHTERKQAESKLREISENLAERAREAARLRAEVEEISAVDPQPGEDGELAARISVLSNLEEIRQECASALQLLSNEDGDPQVRDAAASVAEAAQHLERVSAHAPELATVAESVRSAGYVLADAARELAGFLSDVPQDSAAELAEANSRFSQLQQLLRTYSSGDAGLAGVLEYGSQAALRLAELSDDDAQLVTLKERADAASEREMQLGLQLRQLRQSAGEQLAQAVSEELHALALPNARFEVRLAELSEPAVHGLDEVEFLLAPHPGATPRPLGKAASGGELSRVMLALEVVLAGSSSVPTFVFDEVDSGVGGSAAIEIGRRLAKLAERSQVIVVTHLAQVAAFADNHVQVVKDSSGGFTQSSCRALNGEERLREMARLLSGLSDSESALTHAAELLSLKQG